MKQANVKKLRLLGAEPRSGLPADDADDADFRPHPGAARQGQLRPTPEPRNPRTLEPFPSSRPDADVLSLLLGLSTFSLLSSLFSLEGSRLQTKSDAGSQNSEVRSAESDAATCRLVAAATVGTLSFTPQDAIEVAAEVPLEVPLQIAPQTNLRTPVQIGLETRPAIPART